MAEREAGRPRRELVLASAGSGKTYQLSSRLLGLLARGVPPREILASTFTRKAAGEILDRLLLRLAGAALGHQGELEALPPIAQGAGREEPPGREAEEWGRILLETVDHLPRLHVHTLDAFFHKVAHSFGLELGLPGDWTVADDPTVGKLRSRALDEVLSAQDTGVVLELVRMAGRGDADRSVHDLLLEETGSLLELYRERAPGTGSALWGGGSEGGPDPESDGTPSKARVEEALQALRDLELPTTRSGTVHKSWARAHEAMVSTVQDRDWEAFLDLTLVKKVLAEEERFSRVPIPPELRRVVQKLLEHARDRIRVRRHRRIQALGRLLPEFDGHLRRLQWQRGLYGFADLTHVLLGWDEILDGPHQVHYRLDGRIRHVLLDEFQDTSTSQWAALEPLVGEILAGGEDDRGAFIVADPKQSIYGWRGGEPRILDSLRARYGLEPASLDRSWRSSPPVLEMVNRVFEALPENPVLTHDKDVAETAQRWSEGFHEHTSVHEGRSGYAALESGPEQESGEDPDSGRDGGPGEEAAADHLAWAAARVAEIHRTVPGATIGVLARRNEAVARLIAHLRTRGVEASEEGGVEVKDSGPVAALLALLRVADHPDDRASAYLAARTPVGALVGLEPEEWRSRDRVHTVGLEIRKELLHEGYGPVLGRWVRELTPAVPPRDRERLRRLLELAFQWDRVAGLRPSDFVRAAQASRAEAPGGSPVRVMTIHRAKGLDFDVVVLPELEESSYTAGRTPAFLAEREEGGAGPVRRIVPRVKKDLLPLFPEALPATRQHRESMVRDSLSALYVGLTRARFAVHALVAPDPEGTSEAKSDARLLRHALLPEEKGAPAPANRILWETGERDWWTRPEVPDSFTHPPGSSRGPGPGSRSNLRSRPASQRKRLLPVRTPSDPGGGDALPLARVLRPRPRAAMEAGTLIHRWLEQVEWIEDRWPAEEELLKLVGKERPGATDPAGLLKELQEWVEAPPIRGLLSREAHPEGTTVEREVPFVAREEGEIIQGVADRVLRIPEEAGVRLVVVDWKTDRVTEDGGGRGLDTAKAGRGGGGSSEGKPSGEEPYAADPLAVQAQEYHPQMQAYRRALARLHRLPVERVEGVLAFLPAGRTVPVT